MKPNTNLLDLILPVIHGNAIAMYIKGDCLSPQIIDNDLLIIDSHTSKLGDGIFALKKESKISVRYRKQGVYLDSEGNIFDDEGYELYGKVMALKRDLDVIPNNLKPNQS